VYTYRTYREMEVRRREDGIGRTRIETTGTGWRRREIEESGRVCHRCGKPFSIFSSRFGYFEYNDNQKTVEYEDDIKTLIKYI